MGGFFIHPGLAGAMAGKKEEKKMAETLTLKPFGLDTEALKKAKIFIAVYTPKTSMGKEQIEIEGDGTIRLIRSANFKAPDQISLGKVPQEKAAALFALFEAEGFMDLERNYTTQSPIKNTWKIALTLPTGEKVVSAENGSTPPSFDHVKGAIRVLAGMGAPASLGRQYFFHL